MAEQSTFARRMMAQKLMAEKRDDPFSDSRFFAGKMRPSMADIENPTSLSDMAGPAYGAAATGSLFAPGAGIADVMGYAPDPMQSGQMLPSFGENIGQGNYLDAGLQTLGVAGDVLQAGGAVFPPLIAAGTALKAPRAARVADAAMDAARADPNEAAGAAMDAAQARYFETGNYEPPTAENPVSIVPPTETEPGIIAFHGSGADFDEFRLEMIGTGEGAQAYGYGLYFTDSQDIAKFYKDTVGQERNQIQFKGKPLDSVYTADIYENFGDDISQIIQKAKEMGVAGGDEEIIEDAVIGVFANLSQGLSNMKDAQTAVDSLRSRRSTGFSPEKTIYRYFIEPEVKEADIPEGKMYKVGLAPKPDELMDYDLSLNQQPEKIKKVLQPFYEKYGVANTADVGTLLESVKRTGAIPDDALTEKFVEAGIPGIKYRAAGSRGANVDTADAEMNYVIFDDKAVKILEKYGIVGPVAVTAAGAAAVNRGRNDNDNGGSILPDAGVL
jgi:hypothetical protein